MREFIVLCCLALFGAAYAEDVTMNDTESDLTNAVVTVGKNVFN